nr:hypothetical protein [Hydrogenibacillus schlegelii]
MPLKIRLNPQLINEVSKAKKSDKRHRAFGRPRKSRKVRDQSINGWARSDDETRNDDECHLHRKRNQIPKMTAKTDGDVPRRMPQQKRDRHDDKRRQHRKYKGIRKPALGPVGKPKPDALQRSGASGFVVCRHISASMSIEKLLH